MPKIAFLFAGQGAQHVGMGQNLWEGSPRARARFEAANRLLGYDLASICFSGPEEKLNATRTSQPAVFVTSLASVDAAEDACNGSMDCEAAAGLSLGEYTAYVQAQAIRFEDALLLVQKRAEFMQQASEERPGGMLSIIGLSRERTEDICKSVSTMGYAAIANLNSPVQVVVSAEESLLAPITALAEKAGARRVVRLRVSGGFHSRLMSSARERLEPELRRLPIARARFPVVANVSAKFVSEPEDIRDALIRQMDSPVRWEDSMRLIGAQGFDTFYEVGSAKVLCGLLRSTLGTVRCEPLPCPGSKEVGS